MAKKTGDDYRKEKLRKKETENKGRTEGMMEDYGPGG